MSCSESAVAPRLIICCGMLRASSTLQFQVVADLVEQFLGGCRLPWYEQDELDARLFDLSADKGPFVLKTHIITPGIWSALDEGRALGIFVWRRLSEIAYSAQNFFGYSFLEMMATFRGMSAQWQRTQRHPRIFSSRYENLTGNIEREATYYLRHLGVTETPETKGFTRELAERYSLQRQRERIANLEMELPGTGMSYDTHHLLHRGHIQAANGCGAINSTFSTEQRRALKEVEAQINPDIEMPAADCAEHHPPKRFLQGEQCSRKTGLEVGNIKSSYLNYPFSVGIETLRLCNARCVFCPYIRLPGKGERLPTETIYRLVDEFQKIPHQFSVNFSRVNEPLLDERIPDIYQYAAEKLSHAGFILFTNGSLLDATHRRWILKIPRLTINVSLNEYEPEPYHQMMGLDFYNVWNNLQALHADLPPGASLIISRAGEGGPRDAEFILRIKSEFPKCHALVRRRFTWLNEVPRSMFPDDPCMQYYSLQILANGKVALCCIDGDGRHAIGDTGSGEDIFDIYRNSLLSHGRPHFLQRCKMPQPCSDCDNMCQPILTLPG